MGAGDHVWRERSLRKAVLAGDETAWRAWYDQSFDRLHAYVVWRCAGLADLADEVVQDTWLIAVRRMRSFDPDQGDFGSWLRGIAGNVLRDHLRKRARQANRMQALADPAAQPANDRGVREKRERSERIVAALAELPGRYEEALKAKYLDCMSVSQIADIWKESPKAVESVLTRARQAFREAYLQLG